MDMRSEPPGGGGMGEHLALTECLHCVRHFTQHDVLESAQNSPYGLNRIPLPSSSYFEILIPSTSDWLHVDTELKIGKSLKS